MATIHYEDSMKKALSELAEIEIELEKANAFKLRKETLREQIKDWMKLNNLTEHEALTLDNSQLFRMSLSTTNRKNCNFDLLQATVSPQDYDAIVTKSEFETFKCQPVKSRKNKSAAPSAPKAS